ncbi:unnamed protein product [Adineta ricciae]|uniref:Uncharacterized protein n=1 Tax=Adineta ricciae TaxID=249248 RepID=A0A816ERJ9_ADIRI|nr:unnamed protein product [Adineta ricciae]
MKFSLILITTILLISIVHSRSYSLTSLLRKRTTDDTNIHKASCIVVAEFLMDLFNDPDLHLSSKQMRLIPTLNIRKLRRRGFLDDDCPPEYQKWFMDLIPFEELLSAKQLQILKSKLWFTE